jgi:hypothetical protein
MTESESVVWSMSANDLLTATRALAHRAADLEAELLVHLGEIDERKLYLECAFPSMFTYCVGELGFSEDAAYNRIHVARAGRRFPAILEAIRDGRVHLWGMRLLAPHLTEANHLALIAAAAEKTKREIEQLVADLAPRAPVATVIRSIPEGFATAAMPEAPGAAPSPPPPPAPRAGPPVVPLSAQTYKIQFTAGRAFRDRLREAQDLMRHRVPDGNLESILGAALELLVDQVKKEKFAVGRKPRSGTANGGPHGGGANGEPAKGPTSRHIPDWIKRIVYERDGGRCTFVDDRGRRCEATGALEFEHDEGFARTGSHDPDRIHLLCRAHNQHAADKMYGRSFMDAARNRGAHRIEAGGPDGQPAEVRADEPVPEAASGGAAVRSNWVQLPESSAHAPQDGESAAELVAVSDKTLEEMSLQEELIDWRSDSEPTGLDGIATCSGTSPSPRSSP